jgi:hypothetical protein
MFYIACEYINNVPMFREVEAMGVTYVILPNLLIKIQSKLEGINFVNMIKYSLGLLKIKGEDIPVAESLTMRGLILVNACLLLIA